MSEIVIHSRQVEMIPIGALKGFNRNARTHPASQIQVLANIVREHGWTTPLLIDDDDVIVAGHGRLEVAQKLKMTEVPCVRLANLTPEQIRMIRVSDNQTGLLSGWDEGLLKLELADLQGAGFDLGLTGFSSLELTGIFGTKKGNIDPDDIPPLEKIAVSHPGDIWLMKGHKVSCGDSMDACVRSSLLRDARADCVFTSPPYAVGVDYGATYSDTLDALREMLPKMAASWMDVVAPGGFAVVNFNDIVSGREAAGSEEPCEYPRALEYWHPFRKSGWTLWSRRVWCKPTARVHSPWAIKTNRAASDWENLWTWKSPGKAIVGRVNGEHQSANGWMDTSREHGVDLGKDVHGAGMAVALPVRMIAIHIRMGCGVFEPFCGTGTTLIAAEMAGRICWAAEINPLYVDLTLRRFAAFSGIQPTLAETGETFEQVKARRSEVI